jgi:hypothetical protein
MIRVSQREAKRMGLSDSRKTSRATAELTDRIVEQVELAGLPRPEREYRFDTGGRKWRFDLAWVGRMVAVECHGATWSAGRHTTGGGFEKDREKMNAAALQGWLVLEVTDRHIRNGMAIEWIEMALSRR